MTGTEVGKAFVSEFVIGLGLLSGVWIHVGTNPEAEIFKALTILNPDPSLGFFFWLMPILITVISWVGAYVMGGWIGIVATFLALICGIFLGASFMPYLFIVSLLLGLVAPFTVQD